MRINDNHIDLDISAVSDKNNKEKIRLRDVKLPSGLKKSYGTYIVGSIACFIAAIVMFLLTISPSAAFLVLGAGYCIYSAVDLLYAYGSGKIAELAVICSSIHNTIDKHEIKAVFYTDSEPPEFHEFYLPAKRRAELQENMAYVVYYKESNPKRLLGMSPI